MNRVLFLFLLLLAPGFAFSQDSLRVDTARRAPAPAQQRDSLPTVFLSPVRMDTIPRAAAVDWSSDSFRFRNHPYFKFTDPTRYTISLRRTSGREEIFYLVIGLLVFFALIRNGFARYVSDLFRIYFGNTFRHRQLREQLLQNPLPSLLLNIFFLLSTGLFAALLFQSMKWDGGLSFWVLYLYAVAALLGIYGAKFLTLKLLGWIFQVREATDVYIFVVFTTNKIMGMALLPCLVVLGFTYGLISQAAMTLGLIIIGSLFAYRYFLSYLSIQNLIRISFFHFLLYLFAFEIIPLLLINKLLLSFLGETL